jgi:NADH-quinone oxidoreductase subunit J
MFLYYSIFYCFFSLAIFSSIFVILSANPVFSALFLVLSFFNVSSLIFFLQLDFIPVTLIIVYVGAIAILFLFVLMMLNIKIVEFKNEKLSFLPLIMLFCLVAIIELMFIIHFNFDSIHSSISYQSSFLTDFGLTSLYSFDFFQMLQGFSNIKSLGQLLFVNFSFHFIIAGYVLFLAMIAAITSTMSKKFVVKSQQIYAQVLRSFDKSVVYF